MPPLSSDAGATNVSDRQPPSPPAWRAWFSLIAVFFSFALFAAVRSPVPGVNEPHYLCKAKNLWDPAWCDRDLFLQSADAHAVFLWIVGSATRLLTLEQTAWAGRIAAWLALAYGWTRLVARLVPGEWAGLWSAWAFLGLAASFNLSGEWVVGGVEAKGFAYASVFVAVAAGCARRRRRAGIFCGLAISLHPIVGGWALIAGALALTWEAILRRTARKGERSGIEGPTGAVSFRDRIVSGLLVLAVALPGLVPAIGLLLASPSREVSRQADEIQVFFRLDHHLNPHSFPASAYMAYGAMIVAWLLLRWPARFTPAEPFFRRFVLGTMLIAAGGLAVGWFLALPGLMKFYPFRLFDVMLPVACAVAAAGVAQRLESGQPYPPVPRSGRIGTLCRTAPFLGAFAFGLLSPSSDRNPSQLPAEHWKNVLPSGWKISCRANPSQLPPEHWKNWVAACRWIDGQVPAEALFLTPRFNFAFKWYAQRAEYVAYKDCPQDAASLVEWKRRLDLVREWRDRHIERGFDGSAVAELQRQTGIDYIVAWRIKVAGGTIQDPYAMEPIYHNDSFAVYRVPGVR